MAERLPAEVWPAAEFVREFIDERGWSVAQLAEASGLSKRITGLVVSGDHMVTEEIAVALARAFGTSKELWINLEDAYFNQCLREEWERQNA